MSVHREPRGDPGVGVGGGAGPLPLAAKQAHQLGYLPVDGAWWERIGYLGDPPHDHWWAIQSPADADVVADHVLQLVRDRALPAMRTVLADGPPPREEDIVRVDHCPWPYCTDLPELAVEVDGGLWDGDEPWWLA